MTIFNVSVKSEEKARVSSIGTSECAPARVPESTPEDNLPTMYDLPSESPEEPGLPDEFHGWQGELCSATFKPSIYPADRVFVAADLNLYYDPNHTGWYKRPDWFAVVEGSRFYQGQQRAAENADKTNQKTNEETKELRLSYVIWQEKVCPTIVIEFLSPSTRAEDLGKRAPKGEQPTKWQVYEQILKIPYYLTFDRRTDELRVFCLTDDRYQEQVLNDSRFWFPKLQLGLGLWQGEYHGIRRLWLRWYDADNNWIPTESEQERQRAEQERQRAEQERQRAEQERQRAEQERQRADRLAERLRELGINPNEL